MQDEIKGQYVIVEFVDDLEEAMRMGRERNMSRGVIAGIQAIHDELLEMEGLFTKEVHYKRLNADFRGLIDELSEGCKEGDESESLGSMRQLRDKAGILKVFLEKQSEKE